MNDQELNRMLGRIGKACFVTYFREFDNSSLPNKDVIEILMHDEGYTKNSCQTRTSGARKIIEAGRAKDALMDISASSGVPPEIAAKAKRLAAGL